MTTIANWGQKLSWSPLLTMINNRDDDNCLLMPKTQLAPLLTEVNNSNDHHCWLSPKPQMVTIVDQGQKLTDGGQCWLRPRTLMVTNADWGQEPWWSPLLTKANNSDCYHCWLRPITHWWWSMLTESNHSVGYYCWLEPRTQIVTNAEVKNSDDDLVIQVKVWEVLENIPCSDQEPRLSKNFAMLSLVNRFSH